MQKEKIHTQDDLSQREKLRRRFAPLALLLGGIATSLTINALGNDHAPEKEIKSYTELAQDSAERPLHTGDTILIDGIKLDATDPDRNSGSEAVWNDEEVQQFIRDNPDEKAAVISSAYNLPAVETYAIVERDINNDGDGDAIAVPVIEDKK